MGLSWNTTVMSTELQLENPDRQAKNVLIVDDEPDARQVLANYLSAFCPRPCTVGQAGSVAEAFRMVRECPPDLLFLDVEMGDGTGFDLLDMLPRTDCQVIFTTAHNEFALKAFKYSAVDYLLKPIAPEDFTRAIDRASAVQAQSIRHLLKMVKAPKPAGAFEKIALPSQEGLTVVALGNIVRLEADASYSTFFTVDGERCLVSRSIGKFEELLPAANFLRVHTSHLINLDFVKKFLREDGGYALMEGGHKVPIARRRKDQFLKMLQAKSLF